MVISVKHQTFIIILFTVLTICIINFFLKLFPNKLIELILIGHQYFEKFYNFQIISNHLQATELSSTQELVAHSGKFCAIKLM